jgi:hypothetical protein
MAPKFLRALERPISAAARRYLAWRENSGNAFRVYDEDACRTVNNHDFIDDPKFKRARDAYLQSPFAARGYHGSRWKLYTVIWAAQRAVRLDADIVQLGVFEGTEAAGITDYLDFGHCSIQMFLVDTFTGVPDNVWTADELKSGADQAQWAYKEAGDSSGSVRKRFAKYPNVHVIQGSVPEILNAVGTERVGLLLIDLNCAAPERAALDILWDRIVPGGMVISDDYGHIGYEAQKAAMDSFALERGIQVLPLPTGHGVLIK